MRKRRRMRQTCSARGNRCRGKSIGVKVVWQREKKEMKRQVNRMQEEVLAAANANALQEEIRVQQNDQMNKLLNAEKMSAKQATQELNAERIGKEDALQQHVTEQTQNRI